MIYKLFSIDSEDGLVSSYASGDARKVYRPGKWNYPPRWLQKQGHGIICFKSLNFFGRDRIMTGRVLSVPERVFVTGIKPLKRIIKVISYLEEHL